MSWPHLQWREDGRYPDRYRVFGTMWCLIAMCMPAMAANEAARRARDRRPLDRWADDGGRFDRPGAEPIASGGR